MILEGTTSSGAVVPVQVTTDGKVVAEGRTGPQGPEGPQGPPGPASDIWDRNGTVVSPTNAGDTIATDDNAVQLVPGTPASPLVRTAAGAVGIGTNAPAQSLDVRGNGVFGALSRVAINEVGGDPFIGGGTGSNTLGFLVNNSEKARISSAGVFTLGDGTTNAVTLDPGTTGSPFVRDSSGRIGVGTATPVALLTVGSTSAPSTNCTIASTSAGNGGIYFHDGANFGAITYDHSDDALYFRVNNGEKVRIDSSGRLLVGMNSAPAGTLAGDVVCQGAVVLQSPNGMWWAIEVQDDGTLFASQTSIR